MKINWRNLHRFIAPILCLPILVTTLTGVIYRVGRNWFGMSKESAHIFMTIHEGAYLGEQFKTVYVVINGLGLIILMVTGMVALIMTTKRPHRPADQVQQTSQTP